MKPNEYLLLYASNIPVSGKEGSAIYALDKGVVYQIPNVFIDLIKEWEVEPFEMVSRKFEDQADILAQYVEFIISEDLGFFTDTPEFFPRLNITYEHGGTISSATVAYNGKFVLTDVIQKLDLLNCKYLELIIDLEFCTFADMEKLLVPISGTTIREIRLLTKCPSEVSQFHLMQFLNQNKKLASVSFCQAGFLNKTEINFCKVNFLPVSLKEFISNYNQYNTLIINQEFFLESAFYNTTYFNKVCIDFEGNIKNGLMLEENFGNVITVSLDQIVTQDDFRSLWFTSPDNIEWMKDSELRYCLFSPLKEDFNSEKIRKSIAIR